MKLNHDPLARLFRSAAQAPAPELAGPGGALETRVLARWRDAGAGESADILLAWLRRATIAACALAVATLIWNYGSPRPDRGDELMVADAAMRVGVDP